MFNKALKKRLRDAEHYLALALAGYAHDQIRWEYETMYQTKLKDFQRPPLRQPTNQSHERGMR